MTHDCASSMNEGNPESTTAAAPAIAVARSRPRRGTEFTSDSPAVYTFVRLAATVWTTIATSRPARITSLDVRPAAATNGFVSPLAAATYPPTNVVTTAARSADATRPIRMSRRVGV